MTEHTLLALLTQQQRLLDGLMQLITDEKQALIQQAAEELLRLSGTKAELLQALQHNDKQLEAHPDRAQLSQDAELKARVEDAKERLAQCQQLNELNGQLIEHNLASLNRLAQALQVSRNASSLTYNDKGKTSTISTLGNDFSA
ncbi:MULTISPECIES: flagella synthesis protein FlgN [Shewanella]|uniref:Flagellar protein FlgN n=2 Tax=Shewanella TaxID=22 RepID=A0A975AJ67_9GAMM|nr:MULTISPECIES: flagellar protein FlgN [Shewanella]QSX28977.1 flagellar protein FlgN [Shewanella cyperi]QSX36101.1 flagellar protein FlgN [Shewanella sedimentimangrovi]QSX39709.1 flagellar protein FlgN [Shewanella cyperi]